MTADEPVDVDAMADDAAGMRVVFRSAGAVALTATAAQDPELTIAAAAAMPFLEAFGDLATDWVRRRVSATLGIAAKAADVDPAGLLAAMASDPAKLHLLVPALEAARASAWEARVRVVGAALAAGVLAEDPALVDEERRWIEILSSVEPADLRIIDYLMKDDPERPGYMLLASRPTLARISGYRELLGRALAQLERNALVRQAPATDYDLDDRNRWGFGDKTDVFSRGELAAACLERFRAAGVSAPLHNEPREADAAPTDVPPTTQAL